MAEDYPTYDFNPQSLPPELLQNVGFVAMAAAQLEANLQDLIAGLLGADILEAKALALHMQAPLKDQVIRSLIGLNAASAETIDEADELMDRVKDALERRNVIVHNSIVTHRDGSLWSVREKSRGDVVAELQPVLIEAIEEDAALIYRVSIEVLRFMQAYGLKPRDRPHRNLVTVNRRKEPRQKRISARRNERINEG